MVWCTAGTDGRVVRAVVHLPRMPVTSCDIPPQPPRICITLDYWYSVILGLGFTVLESYVQSSTIVLRGFWLEQGGMAVDGACLTA